MYTQSDNSSLSDSEVIMNPSTIKCPENPGKSEFVQDVSGEKLQNACFEANKIFPTHIPGEESTSRSLLHWRQQPAIWLFNVIPLSLFKNMILFTAFLLIVSFFLPEIRGNRIDFTKTIQKPVPGTFVSRVPETVPLAAETGSAVVKEALARGSNPWEYLSSWMPDPAETIALLARDKDVDDFEESSEFEGEAGKHYERVVELVPVMRPVRDQAITFFTAVHAALVEAKVGLLSDGSTGPVTEKGKSWPPTRKNMDRAHTYALDIFLDPILELPNSMLEIGPEILSASSGIVISASSDWDGGPGIETFKSGGISPNAGNGVIVFDPVTSRFFCYFHLYDTAVSPGMPVTKGTILGRGGDTGSNARKKGHGGHLHMEIFDSRINRFLKNIEIQALVF